MSEEVLEKQQLPDNSLQLSEQTGDEKRLNRQVNANAEIMEAKTAIILLDSPAVFKKNEYIHWRLTSMFKPMAIGEKTEAMEVLYLSHERKHNWLSDYKNDDSNSIMMSAPSAPLSSTLFRQPLVETSSTRKKKQYLYVVTPRTNVITLTKICRLVYMVDLSSSLATVGNTKSQILLFEVFKTLRNSLEGIVHPFCLQVSSNERIMIRPVLHLTVVADCSQFASNVNVIPMLTNHPSMRVFIQNVQITLENVEQVVTDLYSEFMLFQKDITAHRKQMKRKRSSMGYDLEVDGGPIPSYDWSVFDATSLPASMGVEDSSYAKGSSNKTRKLKRKPRSIRSSPSVWGMGKTGGNLTRMLHAGAFALSLLPQQGRSQMILISDGALKSHIHDNTIARQLAEQDVACHVIQIGFNQSFIPGRNFGFLPDVDTLKFLAQATGGTFLYSDECARLTRPEYGPATVDGNHEDKKVGSHTFIQSSIMKKQKDDEMENSISSGEERHNIRRRPSGGYSTKKNRKSPSPSPLEDNWWWNLDPNIYHRHFVLRESNLEKIRTLTPFHPRHYFHARSSTSPAGTSANHATSSATENYSHHHHLRLQQGSSGIMAQSNFPWDPEGTTPPIEWRLLRYREYTLPDNFSPMIAARAREGFYLQSVLFDNKCVTTSLANSSLSSSSSSSENQTVYDKSSKKKKRKSSSGTMSNEERIQITMVLHWKPNVIIEYRLRATWLPINQDQAQWGTLFSRSTSPQVEVFIRSDAEFAHMLQNWNSLRRRAQMMMMMMSMTGPRENHPTTMSNQLFFKGEPQAAQAYANIEKLKTYLQCLFEGDDLLKDWIDPKNNFFSSWPKEQPQTSCLEVNPQQSVQLLGARFRSFWFSRFSTEESRALTRCWYDLDCIDMLVGDISPYMDPKLASSMNQKFDPNIQETIQQSMTSVVTILKTYWADLDLTAAKDNKEGHELDDEEGLVPSFVKFFGASGKILTSDSEWSAFQIQPSFCQIKVKHEYGRLITLRFLFFNVHANIRQAIKTQVMALIGENALLKNTTSHHDLLCTRPLSKLLIRDDDHFKPDDLLFSSPSSEEEEGKDYVEDTEDGSKKKSRGPSRVKQNEKASSIKTPPSPSYPLRQQYQQKSSSWYLPIGLWLTGEHIVHNYLLHSIWSWQTDNYQDAYHRENKMMPVHDLAFQLLCQARLDQGYQLVLPRPDNTHFYQEITFPQDTYHIKKNAHHHHHHYPRQQNQKGKKNDPLCSIQYFIRKDDTNGQGRIVTELWVEPSVNHITYKEEEGEDEDELDHTAITKRSCQNDYDWIKTWTELPDRRIISHLVTFDQIHAIGRTKGKGDFKRAADDRSKKAKEKEETSECTNDAMVKMLLPHLFDVSSVLKTNSFVLASYELPCPPTLPIDSNKKKSAEQHFYSNSANIIPDPFDRLPFQYQTYCMLHHYFEQALEKNLMDGEVVMEHHSPRREFWSILKKAIREECHHGSNMDCMASLKQMKCYVSIIDPRSFLIVLVPDLKNIMTTFFGVDANTQQRSSSDGQPSRFDCLLFKCVRQKPLKAKKQSSASDTISSNEPKRKHHWLTSLLDDEDHNDVTICIQSAHPAQPKLPISVFSPNPVFCGQFQSTTHSNTMPEESQIFLYKVTESYGQAFLRTVYTLLLTHALEPEVTPPMSSSDLVKAMTICHTTLIKIDISRFVNIMACPNITLCKDMDQKWKKALDPYFKPIEISRNQEDINAVTDTADILLYIPPSLLPPTEPPTFCSDGKTPPGQHPLLLGFNVTFDQTNVSALCEKPTSFDQLKRIMVAFSEEKYEEEDTFFAKAFPAYDERGDNDGLPRLTLNLVCKSVAVGDRNKTRRSSENNDGFPANAINDNDTYLTNEQTMILSETVSKIEWMFTEQVLYGLLILQMKGQQDTNREVMRYVVTQLGKSYASANHHQTKFQVPLNFVRKDSQMCTELFMDLFEKKGNNGNDRVYRLDPYFHVIWAPVSLMVTATKQMLIDGSGLGIYVEDDDNEEDKHMKTQVPDSYWLIVEVHLCHVEIYYFALSDQDNTSTLVVDHTISIIRKIEKQTNQKILLDMLQETRICSKYLEAPPAHPCSGFESNDSDSSLESRSSGETQSSEGAASLTPEEESRHHMHFAIGQFQCPIVYRKEFPLHWRVPLGKALNYLKSDVLRPFTVANRTDMYVIEREQTIVYCKLNEKSSIMTPLVKGEPDTLLVEPPASSATPVSAATEMAPSTTAYSLASNELEMTVYGLECPDWIVNDVVTLIENRLMSEVTLDELQTFFTRNPTSKPTISDVRFILPFDKRPPQTEIFRIPRLVSNPSLMLRFLKRFLLADDLKPFKGPNVISSIVNASSYNFEKKNPHVQGDENENQDESDVDLQKDDLCFYYNCTKRVPGTSSAFELACGQGMAGICITLREPTMDQGSIMTTLPRKHSAMGFNFDPDEIRRSLETELRVTSVESDHPYYVWVDVWTMGSVNDQILLQRIHDCYRCALCDYFIEETVTIDLGSVLLYEAAALQQAVSSDRDCHVHLGSTGPSHRQLSTLLRKKFINSIVYMLQKSVEWHNPTVHAVKEPKNGNADLWGMPPWCMKDIISHLDHELIQLDPSLEPTITWKKLGNQCGTFWAKNYADDDADPMSEWLLYRGGPVFCRNNIQNNIRVVAISGLCEFVEQFGGAGSSPATHFSPIHQTVAAGPWKSTNRNNAIDSHSPSVQHRYIYHPHHAPYSQRRRTSLKSDPSRKSSTSTKGNNNDSMLPSTTSSIKSFNANEQQQQESRRMSYQKRSRGSSTSFPHPSIVGDDATTSIHPLSQTPSLVPRADPEKHCFLIMIMDVDRLVLYSYNWIEQHRTHIFNSVFSVAHQQRMRSNVLNSILHQKMGLFHHSLSFEGIAQQYLSTEEAIGQERALVSPHSGHPTTAHSATPVKIADEGSKSTKTQYQGRPALKKTKSELKVSTHPNTLATISAPTTPRNWTASEISIQNVICMDLPMLKMASSVVSTPGSNTKKYITGGGRITSPILKPAVREKKIRRQRSQRCALSYGGGGTNKLNPLSMANQDLNYVLMDAISDPVNAPEHNILVWKDMRYTAALAVNDDLLRRHGGPYLDTYLQHASLVSVHRKALQIYLKWRKRFGGGGEVRTPLASPMENNSGQEKLTRYEVSEILRSSRLLHFCRAPFFFFTGTASGDGDNGTDQKTNEQGKVATNENTIILNWYRQYLRTFVVNYSSYLEKLNLQVVEFPSSERDSLSLLPSPILNSDVPGSADGQENSSLNDSNDENHSHYDDDEDHSDDESTDHVDDTDLNTSKFDTGIQGLTVEHPSTYLLKVSDAGSIICEVRFTHTFVSVSLYGLHRQHGLSNFQRSRQESREAKRMHFKKFEQSVGQLKHLIHINSFVYDFHLYYMQHLLILMHKNKDAPAIPPLGVSLIGTLRRFHSFYITPTHYSTNRLFSGVYECNHHLDQHKKPYIDLSHFFKYLYKDHSTYGLDAVIDSTVSNVSGVYLTSRSVSFNDDTGNNDDPAWKYTLVLCPMTEKTLNPLTLDQNPQESPASVTATSVLIRYFILAVYQPERTPSSLVKNFWTTPTSSSSSYHPNLIVNARKKIDGIVSKVIKACKQRFNWRVLLPEDLKSDRQQNGRMDSSGWYQLLSKFQSLSLLSGENSELNLTRLIGLRKEMEWQKIFGLFLRMHQDQCRNFTYKAYRHLLFYHPPLCMDSMIHIMLYKEEDTEVDDRIEIKVVRREPRFIDKNHILSLTQVEQEQVAILGQSICYILWKYAKD